METVRRTLAPFIAPVAHRWPFRPLLARPSSRRIVLVAIARDEVDYLLEWVAWHRSQGFTRFIIGDHESEDGTTELLEALEVCGVVQRRHVVPVQEQSTQVRFYNQVVREIPRGADPILGFLDLDEFVMGAGNRRLAARVARVFRDDRVSALGLNWRVIGSSGYERQNAGPVLARFGAHAGREFEKNRWIKSFIRRSRLASMEVHHARLRYGRYVDTDGNPLVPESAGLHRTASVSWDGVFIGHYVVKSRREFDRKKRWRGSVSKGPGVEKGTRYFEAHDRNERFTPLAGRALRSLMREQTRLLARLQARSLYCRPCFGEVWIVEGTRTLQGWLAYAGPHLEDVRVTFRHDGEEWHSAAFEDGEWRAPEGGEMLPRLAFSLSLDALGEVSPARLEIRPYGSCVRLPLRASPPDP